MAKVTFGSLKLKKTEEVNKISIADKEIEVKTYLPIEDKYDLIMITLQKAEEDGIYNDIKLDMYFHLNLVYMYTNLSFTEKQKENEAKIYDTLQSNGFFNKFLATLNEDEYADLYNALKIIAAEKTKYNCTFAAIAKSFITDLPSNAEAAAKIVENFDPEQYKAVLDFVNAANGNRNFKTNQPIAAA